MPASINSIVAAGAAIHAGGTMLVLPDDDRRIQRRTILQCDVITYALPRLTANGTTDGIASTVAIERALLTRFLRDGYNLITGRSEYNSTIVGATRHIDWIRLAWIAATVRAYNVYRTSAASLD